MQILMVLTSHGQLGATGKPTGLWLEELATPWYVFRDAGAQVVLASPKGGRPPIDPASEAPDRQSESTRRFQSDAQAQHALANTQRLADIDAAQFDALFYAGGHGPLWDLADNEASRLLIDRTYAAGKPVAAVCHGVAALKNALGPFGLPLVRGKPVTGFSNAEEHGAGLAAVVPFQIEDMLRDSEGEYSSAADWQPHVVVSGNLITGQNPASSAGVAKAILQRLAGNTKAA